MKKSDLMNLVGSLVEITFLDGTTVKGKLGYTEEFSEKFNFRKPNRFTIKNYDFRVSHIKSAIKES